MPRQGAEREDEDLVRISPLSLQGSAFSTFFLFFIKKMLIKLGRLGIRKL